MTEPHKKLLQPDIMKVQAQELIDIACPIIEELRNYATQIFVRCLEAGTRRDGDLSVFFMFQHVIEMSDGVLVLLKESCCGPALPVVRSMLEVVLAIEYIMESKDEITYLQRLRSWNYVEGLKDIKRFKNFDEKHQPVKPLKKMLSDTRQRDGSVTDYSKAIEELQERLDSEEDENKKEIREEYKRTCEERRQKQCEWYALFDGPNDLRDLAKRIGHEHLHAFLYSELSRVVHGGHHRRYIVSNEPNGFILKPLRTYDDFMGHARWTCIFLLKTIDLFVHRYRRNEVFEGSGYSKWYDKMNARIHEIDWS